MENLPPITFTAQSYLAGGRPVYLLSGEFHYFRVPKPDWRRRMRLFKESGGNCLATYIPWMLHEPQEGRFVFAGEDWLDLEGFLLTAREENLYVIARPGPYQYSELVNAGLPGWLLRDYPQILAQTSTGEPINYFSVSYTHPVFLQKTSRWFDAVLPILSRFTLDKGGPIAFVQVDNETIGIHEWFGSIDYHPASMGIGQHGGAYPQFLEGRYDTIGGLNKAYEAEYQSFAAVRPAPGETQSAAARMRWQKDYFDFYLTTIADYFAILAGQIRAYGIDVPIMHNSGTPGMNAYFLEANERMGSEFLLGSDHYYNLDQTWPQNQPTPQYAARCFLSLEMLRLMGFPPSVLEIPGGSASNWPPILADDALASYMTNLAFGMKGSNYYIFTGGPNPPGAGQTTDLYDYDASISASGEVRELYTAQKTFGQFIQSHPGLLSAPRLIDMRIGIDFEHHRSENYWKLPGPFLFTSPAAAKFLRTGVLTSLLCASLSPEMVNIASDAWIEDTSTPLIIVSSSSMGAEKQQRLVNFMLRGGKLLIAPVIPEVDDTFQPCSILADFLGSPHQTFSPLGFGRPGIANIPNVFGSCYPFTSTPPDAHITGVEEHSKQPVALTIETPGGGQVIILGLTWLHSMHEHENMISALLETLGLKQVLRTGSPNVWASAYNLDGKPLVFLMNLFNGSFEVNPRTSFNGKDTDFGQVTVDPFKVKVIEA